MLTTLLRFFGTLSFFLIILAAPCGVSAAVRPIDVLRMSDEIPVGRGEFVRAVVKILGVSLKEYATLPYQRQVPPALVPYIKAAYREGALTQFGGDLLLSRPIRRGEALIVVRELLNLEPEEEGVMFRDVPEGSALSVAVNLAIERKWFEPLLENVFGVQRVLTARDARLLLGRVTNQAVLGGEEGEEPQQKITVRIVSPEVQKLPKNDLLQGVWQILREHFLYQENINPDDAAYKAAEALVKSLNDPYTTFMRPIVTRQFQTQIQGEVTGIGAQVEYINGILTILTPLPGSPAEKSGLKPGDQILSVNVESLSGMDFAEAVEKVRGPKGSVAKLRVRRDGVEFDTDVMRDTIKVPEIDITYHGQIAVVKLLQFGELTNNDLPGLLTEVQSRNPKGIILDLRNNPGGLLSAAESVLGNFLPRGTPVAKIKTRKTEVVEVTNRDPGIHADLPLVVLVNEGSASASEIVAGALQDTKRATIVGKKTFGKGTVQQVLQFSDGSSVKLTIAEWFTPSGQQINGKGVMPDITVESSDTRDEQLLRALDLLR